MWFANAAEDDGQAWYWTCPELRSKLGSGELRKMSSYLTQTKNDDEERDALLSAQSADLAMMLQGQLSPQESRALVEMHGGLDEAMTAIFSDGGLDAAKASAEKFLDEKRKAAAEAAKANVDDDSDEIIDDSDCSKEESGTTEKARYEYTCRLDTYIRGHIDRRPEPESNREWEEGEGVCLRPAPRAFPLNRRSLACGWAVQ